MFFHLERRKKILLLHNKFESKIDEKETLFIFISEC